MSAPGNHKGYKPEVYLSSIIMMLHIGGKYIEDVRLVDRDPVLKSMALLDYYRHRLYSVVN